MSDLLKVVGEPVAWRWKHGTTQCTSDAPTLKDAINWEPLYTESKLQATGWRQCAVGQGESQYCGMLEAEKAKAYAQGQKDMRERAALTVLAGPFAGSRDGDARFIRALPIEGEQK